MINEEQSYQCQCRGCPNGYGSEFTDAPAEWFTSKGLTIPKNCQVCRSWIQSQTDETKRCPCGRLFRLPAKFKISHHKKVGALGNKLECAKCERGERPVRGSSRRKTPEQVLQELNSHNFTKLAKGTPLQPLLINTDLSCYQNKVPVKGQAGLRETRQRHLERHMPGSEHSEVGMLVEGRSYPPSPTAFVDVTTTDPQTLLNSIQSLLLTVDGNRMREYPEKNGRIVRYTLMDSDEVECTVLAPSPDGYIVITTYDNISIDKNGKAR